VDLTQALPQVPVEVKEDLMLKVRPTRILDWGVKELQNKKIFIIRVLWRSAQIEDETWEREYEMRKKYLELFKQSIIKYKSL
jgi:hypothetical protein